MTLRHGVSNCLSHLFGLLKRDFGQLHGVCLCVLVQLVTDLAGLHHVTLDHCAVRAVPNLALTDFLQLLIAAGQTRLLTYVVRLTPAPRLAVS